MTTKPLTRRQGQTLQFIKSFITKNTYPPTVREIAEHLDLKSHSTAFSLLEQLVSKGHIKKGIGPRMIQVIDQGKADEEPQLKEFEVVVIDGRLVIDLNELTKDYKVRGYTGQPEAFDCDEIGLIPVVGKIYLTDEQYSKIQAAYTNGGECDWCGEIVPELSRPHMHDFVPEKRMCKGCWDHDREVYKGSYGDDIGEFEPIGGEKL